MPPHSRLSLIFLLVFCAVFSFRSPPAYAGGGYGIVYSTANIFEGDVIGDIKFRERALDVFSVTMDFHTMYTLTEAFIHATHWMAPLVIVIDDRTRQMIETGVYNPGSLESQVIY